MILECFINYKSVKFRCFSFFFRELQKNSHELAGLIIINKCLPRLALCEMLSQCTSAALAVRWLKHKPLASSAISCRVKAASNLTVLLPPCLHCQRWLPRRLPCVSEKYSHPLLQAWLTTKLHKNNPCCSNTQPWHREAGPVDKILIIVIMKKPAMEASRCKQTAARVHQPERQQSSYGLES